MQGEFLDEEEEDMSKEKAACASLVRDGRPLLALLDKYNKLVIGDDETPDPTRYYKGQTFTLDLSEDDKIRGNLL